MQAQAQGRMLPSAADARAFMLAGNATMTLVSKKTGTRFTYKVRRSADAAPVWFVALLTGADNENDFRYLGFIRDHGDRVVYGYGAKSSISREAPSAKAIAFACEAILGRDHMPTTLEVWHEGKCGRCGRKLTVPESIDRGLGPECAEK